MRGIFTVVFVFVLQLQYGQMVQIPESSVAIFKYQRSPVPKYTVDSSFVVKEVVVERIVFMSTDSFMVSAYLTKPNKPIASNPLVVFSHWSEGNKNEFLQEAERLSDQGFVCVLLDGPWLCPDSPIKSFKTQAYEMYRQQVMNVRRAIDLAQQHFEINPDQIFCVGHSFGCNTAAILSGVDKRIDYFVFMTGVYRTTENIRKSQNPDIVAWRKNDPQQFDQWIRKMKPLDAENFLPYKTAPCLIQIGNKDEYLTDPENDAFIKVAAVPKEIKIYDSGHALNKPAQEDRVTWILKQLGN